MGFYQAVCRSQKKSVVFWIGLALVFLLALLPRTIYSVSRPMQWYDRSVHFWDALQRGAWADTYQQYHPGVAAMWIAGFGIRVCAMAHGWSMSDMIDPSLVVSGTEACGVEAGVVALSLVIAGAIGLVYVLLARLVSRSVAFCAGCLLALDPFYITHSKVLHLDALLASFMLVSVLFLACYLREKNGGGLVLSGVFAGLSFLTKSASAFLIPYALLMVVVHSLLEVKSAEGDRRREEIGGITAIVRKVWNDIRIMGIWGLVAGLLFVLVWPAMWVNPFEVLSRIINEALFWSETPHTLNFFAGRVLEGDPGPLYYLATLAWKTTIVTLPAGGLAVFYLLRRKNRKGAGTIWGLLIYAAGYFLMMAVSAKKGLRYLLPMFLALDIVAAWGLVQLSRIVGHWRQLQRRAWVSKAVIAVVLMIQAFATLRYHPYYGIHYNLLLGGAQVAQHVLPLGDQGEGLDLAVRFLNSYPGAGGIAVGVPERNSRQFRRSFVGQTLHIEQPEVDYWVFTVNVNQRELDAELWVPIWEQCREIEPLWSVSFEGIPYVWIYRAYPHRPEAFPIERRLDAGFGDHISLLGYRLDTDALSAPGVLTVTLFWQSDGRVVDDYQVFVHLVDSEGMLVAQHDGVPATGERPTSGWRDAEVVRDEHDVILDADLPGGAYMLYVGLYDFLTGVRVPAVGATGEHLTEDCILLEQIQVLEK